MDGKVQEYKSVAAPSSLEESRETTDFIRLVAHRTFTSLKPEPAQAADVLAGHVVKYVLNNYPGDVTLKGIAREVGLSKFHLVRRFRSITGITPGAFLKRVRLVKAMDLLVESRLEIKHVAHAVGYTDVTAFCRAFRSATGSVPRMYRLTRREAVQARSNNEQETA